MAALLKADALTWAHQRWLAYADPRSNILPPASPVTIHACAAAGLIEPVGAGDMFWQLSAAGIQRRVLVLMAMQEADGALPDEVLQVGPDTTREWQI